MIINFIVLYRKSSSCNHVSALLHALVALTPPPSPFQSQSGDPQPCTSAATAIDSDILPITSYLCTWKAPRKRKESTQQMSEIMFESMYLGEPRTGNFSYLKSSIPVQNLVEVQ